MIRTFGLGPWVKNGVFFAFGLGPRAKIVGKSQGKRKNNALGKMANFGLFFGPWMVFSCPKRRLCFDNFPNVSRVLCIFSSHNTTQHTHHTTRISLCFLWFSVFFHNTQPHTHNTHNTPATDRELESGLSKSHTRKNPRNMPEKGKVRGIPGEGSSRYGRASRSSAPKWRKD